MSGEPADSSGPSLRLVLGTISVLVVAFGFLGYYRYTQAEAHFADVLAEMDQLGPTVDTEGCVSAVLEWNRSCPADPALCSAEVTRVITHCLVGRDRSKTCEGIDLSSAEADWVFERCEERGTPCHGKKCACADAYRAIDSFCRYGQQGVSL